MLHEFKVMVPYQEVDAKMEALTIVGLYNLFYEPTIEVQTTENGYDFIETNEEMIQLNIYQEENEIDSPDLTKRLIATTLGISKEMVQYARINESAWDANFDDINLKNGWVICYSGLVDLHPNENCMLFEPQAAFGTGLHETTQDCLRFILSTDFSNKSVLDLGAGSGVLSIAAALKNAKHVIAIDHEPIEREVTHNSKLNKVDNKIEVIEADLLTGVYKVKDAFDWIFINIGAEETIRLLNRHQLTDKSDNFVISGLVEWNTYKVVTAFQAANYQVVERHQKNEWVTIVFRRGDAF